MSGTIEYQFTESLFATSTHEAGELSGIATIDYNGDGAWSVEDITLDGWNKSARTFDAQVPFPKNSDVYRILEMRLTTGKTRQFIQSDVDTAREDERESRAANRADHDYKLAREAV